MTNQKFSHLKEKKRRSL